MIDNIQYLDYRVQVQLDQKKLIIIRNVSDKEISFSFKKPKKLEYLEIKSKEKDILPY